MEARAGQPIPAERRDEILRGAIDQLVVYTLLSQESRNRGIKIDDAEIETKMGQLKAQFPTQEAFDKALKDRGMTVESLRKDARVDLSVTKLMEAEVGGAPGPERSRGEGLLRQESRPLQAGRIGPRQPHPDPRGREGGRRGQEEGARRDRRVLKQAKGGADFAKLAQQHSQDGSAAQGGDLNYFAKGHDGRRRSTRSRSS